MPTAFVSPLTTHACSCVAHLLSPKFTVTGLSTDPPPAFVQSFTGPEDVATWSKMLKEADVVVLSLEQEGLADEILSVMKFMSAGAPKKVSTSRLFVLPFHYKYANYPPHPSPSSSSCPPSAPGRTPRPPLPPP